MKIHMPEWETLRIVGKSKIVGITILVPFIGYLILFNEGLFSYFNLAKELLSHPEGQLESTQETISRLYYLYYGLTFLAVSSIAFAFICPTIVKNNKNEYEYINNEIAIKTYAKMSAFIKSFETILKKDSKEDEEVKKHLKIFRCLI